MHARLIIAALLLNAATAFAQGEGETPPETPPQQPPGEQVPAEKAAVKAPAVKLDPQVDKEEVTALARNFFTAVLLGETRPLMELSGLPFSLEDKRLSTEDEFIQAWQKALRKNTNMLTLYGVEVVHSNDMEKKFGKPPARLANFPWKKPTTYIAIGNISGRAAILVVQKTGEGMYAAVGYHD